MWKHLKPWVVCCHCAIGGGNLKLLIEAIQGGNLLAPGRVVSYRTRVLMALLTDGELPPWRIGGCGRHHISTVRTAQRPPLYRCGIGGADANDPVVVDSDRLG